MNESDASQAPSTGDADVPPRRQPLPDVTSSDLHAAMVQFDREFRDTPDWSDWENDRRNKYAIQANGNRLYPVKKIISLATGVPTAAFSGGESHANLYVSDRGLNVVALREESRQTMYESFQIILETYATIRTSKPFGQEPQLWHAFEAIKAAIEESLEVRSRSDIKVTWSVGRGNWARVPWLALLSEKETTSTQSGVYCVFLFREDMSGVYLTLNQGVTEPKDRLGAQAGLAEIESRARKLRSMCSELLRRGFTVDGSIELRAGATLGQDYERSTIAYKLYEKGQVPGDVDIHADIAALLKTYDRYLDQKEVGRSSEEPLEQFRKTFLDRMTGFESFPTGGPDSTYAKQERNYKDELVKIYREELEARLSSEPDSPSSDDKLAADIHAFLRRKLSSSGKAQNLLGWRDYDFFNRIEDEKKRQFVAMLRGLLYGEGETGERIERFSSHAVTLFDGEAFKVTPGWTRLFPTFFLMIAFPEDEIFVKTRQFRRAGEAIMGSNPMTPQFFDDEQYQRVMQLAATVRQALEKWGWAPRDMIDVQSFIWVANCRVSDHEEESELDDDPAEEESLSRDYREPSFAAIRDFVIDDRGMRLSERMLRRYHLAIKSSGFVILSGVSGTGKTWLANAYAKAVGAEVLVVPVAPNWTTNEDLLGFLNPLDGVYHHTEFSRFLDRASAAFIHAKKNDYEPRPFHLILDEMNLARVEYYFAKFLSARELSATGQRAFIELSADYRIELNPNLAFIGTVNIDETTHGFADKVYDRSQLIELEITRDLVAEHLDGTPYSQLLLRIWDAVSETAPFAFRVLDDIDYYAREAEAMGISWKEAVDDQILQKILPKLKGADPRVGEALERVLGICGDDFPLTGAKARLMADRFQRHGYASYF